MSRIKVSVIIPVFNTASYLKEAVVSVFNQTLKEIEIIAVNDGSTDNSLDLLNDLSLSDSRLKVVSFEKNVGVSICRNAGFDAAQGEFIYFFDSDDIIESDCLEICYRKMESGKYDFLIFDGVSFSDDGIKAGFNATYQRTHLMTKDEYDGTELVDLLIQKKKYSCSICLCLVRRSFIDGLSLRFHPGVLYEDVLYTIQLYLSAKSITFIPWTFFHRRVRENSTMTSKVSAKNIDYRLTVGNELLKLEKHFNDKLSLKILNHQTRSLFIFLIKTMLRSGQFGLLAKYSFRITRIIIRSFL